MTVDLVLKIARVVAPVLIGAVIGGVIVGKAQQVRIDAKAVELTKVQQELTVCQDANETSQAAISNLKGELKTALQGCEARIRQKEHAISEIKRIESLTPRGDHETVGSSDDDPILAELNRMFPDGRQAGDKD